jgi:AraC-like DNA-binding protein
VSAERLVAISAGDVRAVYARAAQAVQVDLAGLPPSVRHLFTCMFRSEVKNGATLAVTLGLKPAILKDRLLRAHLPSPRTYAATARLVIVADLLVRYDASYGVVADALEYSAPQHLLRQIKALTGLTIRSFRAELGGDRMLTRFRETLVLAHRDGLWRLQLPSSPPAARHVTHGA